MNNSRLKAALELLSIVGPILCLIDCVVIPAVLMILPIVGAGHVCHGVGDQILFLLVLCICAPTITAGFLRHRRVSVFAMMLAGFGLMFFANFGGHFVDDTLHLILTTLGSVFLIKANFDNKQLNKATCCACHEHGAQK